MKFCLGQLVLLPPLRAIGILSQDIARITLILVMRAHLIRLTAISVDWLPVLALPISAIGLGISTVIELVCAHQLDGVALKPRILLPLFDSDRIAPCRP